MMMMMMNQLSCFILQFLTVIFHFECVDGGRRGIKFQITPPIQSFHGRGEFLAKLHISVLTSKLKSSSPPSPSEIQIENQKESSSSTTHQHHHHQIKFITGNPAIGKTEAVRKYVEKYGPTYKNLIWLNALDGLDSLKFSFVDLALSHKKLFNYSSHSEQDLHKIELDQLVEKIYSKITGSTLIVFDDVPSIDGEEANFLHKFLPPLSTSSSSKKFMDHNEKKHEPIILVISKKFEGHWGPLCDDIEIFPLGGWTVAEQIDFFLDNIGLLNDFEKDDAAKQESKELGQLLQGIPLAIQLAAAFVKETRMGLKDYAQMYQLLDDTGKKNLTENNEDLTPKMDPIYATWLMTRHELEETDEGTMAVEVMEILSILHHCDTIPQTLLHDLTLPSLVGHSKMFEEDQENIFTYSLSILENYGLVRNKTGDEDHGEIIECQKQIAGLVHQNMKFEQKDKLQSSVMTRAGNFLNKIYKQDEENLLLSQVALTGLEKFVDYYLKSIMLKNKEEVTMELMKSYFKFLSLKIKMALVYEKMMEKMGVKVNIFMEKFGRQLEKGMADLMPKDEKEREKLAKTFLDDVLKFPPPPGKNVSKNGSEKSVQLDDRDPAAKDHQSVDKQVTAEGENEAETKFGGHHPHPTAMEMVTKILMAIKENLTSQQQLQQPSKLYILMEEWRKNVPKKIPKKKSKAKERKKVVKKEKHGKKKGQNKFQRAEL